MLANIRYWLLGVGAAIACIYCFTFLRSTSHFECDHAADTCTYSVTTVLGTSNQQIKISDIEAIDIETSRGRRSGNRYTVVLLTQNDKMPLYENGTSSSSRAQRLAEQVNSFLTVRNPPQATPL